MWHVTGDVEVYADRVWDLLAADPEASTVGLTVIEALRSGVSYSGIPPVFGWLEEEGSVTGAFLITPPYPLLISAAPEDRLAALVVALRENSVPVVEAHGSVAVATRFAEAWTRGAGLTSEEVMRQRLYRLGELHRPDRAVGEARTAAGQDLEVLAGWYRAFNDEAGGHAVDHEEAARRAADEGVMTLWEIEGGEVVSMAGRRAAAAGVARVGPVYTPPEHRRRGFGAAVTAACTQAAIEAGAESVVLFTDLANPVSNSIYQAIGYVPVSDRLMVRFTQSA